MAFSQSELCHERDPDAASWRRYSAASLAPRPRAQGRSGPQRRAAHQSVAVTTAGCPTAGRESHTRAAHARVFGRRFHSRPFAGIRSVLEQEPHDLLLLGARALRAARARRIRCEVERGRPLPAVRRVRTSAALEETANGLGTPCANGAMQRGRARLVLVLDVGPCVEEELNHRSLRRTGSTSYRPRAAHRTHSGERLRHADSRR